MDKKVPTAHVHRAIVQKDDPVLHAPAAEVSAADIRSPRIVRLLADMKRLLATEKYGVGLAAPQVGESLQIFIVAGRVFEEEEEQEEETVRPAAKTAKKSTEPDRVFINPKLLRTSRTQSQMSEGCLSVRGLYGAVVRHTKATVRALDEQGKVFTLNGTGLLAQIFQHELDHLNGVLYIDKAVYVEPAKEENEEDAPKKPKRTKKKAL